MQLEDLFESLETQSAETLIRLADSTDVLIEQEPYDLITLIQELAGRLEDVLNIQLGDEDDDGDGIVHEYND